MSWIVEAPNNNPSVFVLISSTVFQIDGYALAQPVPSHEGNGRSRKMCTPRSDASFEVHRKFIDGFHLAATV
jgi:hypothetical protein